MPSSVMPSESERHETQSSTEAFAGVPLVQFAAVAAARAEGFPLEEILHAEGLEPSSYRAADVAYKRRLIDPIARERVSANYQNELARAEDRLSRKCSPIDEDVDAWVRFLNTYGGQAASADWLVAIGLTLPDLSRLSRSWKRRFDADDALCKRAEESARDKMPYDVSSLRVGPAKHVPSPLATPLDNQALGDAAPFSKQSTSPVKRWIPKAELLAESAPPFVVPQNLGIAFDLPVSLVVDSPLAKTNLVFSIPHENVLPFVSGPDISDDAPTPEEEAGAIGPPRDSLSGTLLAVDIPRGLAMPFVTAKDGSSPELTAKPIHVVPFSANEDKPPPKPLLSLEQHAALTVEIATYPAHALAILKRYGLTPPQKVDLDQHYQRTVASDPAQQAAWHAAYGAHYATLMRAPRR